MFPISPAEGQLYTTSLGTRYRYDSTSTAWNILSQAVLGNQGYTGIQGQTGIAGIIGLDGSTGLKGDTGIQGLIGLSGQTGLQGIAGDYGQTGIQGIQGETGHQGDTGVQGQTGIQGQTGVQGQTGYQGDTGVIGQTGYQGVTGIYGQTGVQGDTGVQGQTGYQGNTGVKGDTGVQGQTGVQGSTGVSGQTGVQGVTGLANFIQTASYTIPVDKPLFMWSTVDEALYASISDTSSWIQLSAGSLEGPVGPQGLMGATGVGPTGSTGLQGTQGVTGPFYGPPGETGLQGHTGVGGGVYKASELVLGDPTDGTYSGIFSFDSSTITANAIDNINDLLLAISPAAPSPLSGNLTLSNTVKYSAILPMNLSAAWYQDGKVAGNTIADYVVDGTYNLLSPSTGTTFKVGSTFAGDIGSVSHYEDGVLNSSRDVTSGVGVTGTVAITDLAVYNTIWRKGNARVDYTQSTEGYKNHQMRYTVGSSVQQTNVIKFWLDNSNATPSFSTGSAVSQNTLSSSKYLSGVRYYSTGDVFNVSAVVDNIAYKAIHPTAPVYYYMPGVSTVTKTINGASFDASQQYSLSETATINASTYSVDARMTVVATKPNGLNASSVSSSENRLVHTYGNSGALDITMYDEYYRFPLSTNFAVVPGSLTGNWTSSTALSNGNALLYNSTWYYPNINFSSGYLPSQSVNYSSFSGNQVIVWGVNIGNAHSSMSIVFTGITVSDIGAVGAGNLNIEVRLPSVTVWLDAGTAFGTGNGCQLGSSSGSTLNLSFGTYSSSSSSGVVFIRVTLRNTSAAKASRMQISGT